MKNIVLMASYSRKFGKANSFGTGFLISFKGKTFAVTCRHVTERFGANPFVIPNLKQTKNPKNGYAVIQIGKIHKHPQNFDVAVCELLILPGINYGTEPILVANDSIRGLKQNDQIKAYGFPVDYVENMASIDIEAPLPPMELTGKIQTIPTWKYFDFFDSEGRKIEDTIGLKNFAESEPMGDLAGYCGSPVFIDNKVVGIYCGDATFKYNGQKHYGIVFIHFDEALKILESIPIANNMV